MAALFLRGFIAQIGVVAGLQREVFEIQMLEIFGGIFGLGENEL